MLKLIHKTTTKLVAIHSQFNKMKTNFAISIPFVFFALATLSGYALAADDHDSEFVRSIQRQQQLDNQLLPASGLETLASLPTLDEAIALLMSVMKAPITKLVRTMAEPHAKLVRTFAAVRDAKQAVA